MEWYRLTHPSENFDPFWVGPHLGIQIRGLTVSECEEKCGKVATPCCTQSITSLGKDAPRIVDIEVGLSKLFDF